MLEGWPGEKDRRQTRGKETQSKVSGPNRGTVRTMRLYSTAGAGLTGRPAVGDMSSQGLTLQELSASSLREQPDLCTDIQESVSHPMNKGRENFFSCRFWEMSILLLRRAVFAVKS